MKSIFILLILVSSCAVWTGCKDNNVLYSKNQELSADYTWKKADIKTFEIDVTNNAHPHELAITFRYATGYMYDKVLLKVTETGPDKKVVRRDVDIQLRDEKGEFIGEKGFDIIDLEYIFDSGKEYPTIGKYTYTIEQDMPEIDPLDFAMEVGMILRDKPSKN
ncbi:MAG: gliding motility lipoprotein GldH [Flavobacteriales bacterium]